MAENSQRDGKVTEFPNFETTSEETKSTPEYSQQCARAIVDKYKRNKAAISPGWKDFFHELRLYGAGRQSTDQYKTFLSGGKSVDSSDGLHTDETKEIARKGWYSIQWDDVFSFLPNLRSQILGHFSSIDQDIRADNIDIDSGATEERKMLELHVDTHPVFSSLINDLKQTANIPIEEPKFIPEGINELEEMLKDGGFKEPYVLKHEQLLQHTENISGWDRFLKPELLSDIIDLGYIFAYVDFDEETCMPKWRYANPQDVIMQYSSENGFKESDYAGVKEQWTISRLKQYKDQIVHKDGHVITEEEFKQIAQSKCGKNNNPDEAEWSNYTKQLDTGQGYDSFKVDVTKTWWIDVEYIKRIKYTNKYGKMRLYDYQDPDEGAYDVKPGVNSFKYKKPFGNNYSLKVDPGERTSIAKQTKRADGFDVVANSPGKISYKAYYNIGKDEQFKKVRLRKLYYCWWIEGTDFCIKYGCMPNQPRYEYIEPLLPLVGYRYPFKSMTFRAMPIENLYAIAAYRLQNAMSKAMQGIYAINTSLLGDNGKKLDPLKVLKAMRENQVLFYKMGINGNVGGTPVPLNYIPGNLGEAIANEVAIMNQCMQWVQDQTGFSLLALGAQPAPEQGKGVMEMSLNTTQKSLLPMMDAMMYMKEELAKRTSSLWQTGIQNDARLRQQAAKIIGEDGVYVLQQAKSLDVQYGIKLVARPDNEIKQAIMQAATISFQNKEITSDERLFIIEQLTSGENPREIRMRLRKMIQKNKKAEHEMGLQNIKAQGEENARLAQVQAQSAEAIKMAELKAADGMARIKAQADIITRNHDSWCKINEIIAQAKVQAGQPVANPLPQEPQPQQAPQQMPPQQIPMQNGS